jgi:hypothetical protein
MLTRSVSGFANVKISFLVRTAPALDDVCTTNVERILRVLNYLDYISDLASLEIGPSHRNGT